MANLISMDERYKTRDDRYVCVSMEQINYTPVAWEEIKLKFGGK